MDYIFVSYSRRQLYFAESVALYLQRAGLEVWFDLQKLTPGVEWAAALRDGYSNCSRLILVASQAALQSPYVQAEWEAALQNRREVILVLTEAVVLPEALLGCPVYDARVHFERTIQSLTGYLRGEQPARHDPVPLPGKSPYSLNMPFDIWLTLGALFTPTLTAWIAILILPPSSIDFNINLDFIAQSMPHFPAQEIVFNLMGFAVGGYLALVQFPIRGFWKHEVEFEELEKIRWNLLAIQILASLLAFVFITLTPDANREPVHPLVYLIWLCTLLSVYWSFWTLRRSPDILRWLPSGEADQDVRETVQKKLSADVKEQPVAEKAPRVGTVAGFALHHHLADSHNARYIAHLLRSSACRSVPEKEADTHLVIVSNRTSKGWLLDLQRSLSGQVIHILTTNINTPPDIQPVLQTQWVDFRTGRARTIQALAAHLMGKENAHVHYALQISPTGFDNANGFPRRVGYVLGSFYLLLFLLALVMAILPLKIDDWLGFVLIAIPGIPLLFYVDALAMRKVSLPLGVHKWLGNHVAWFASPAPAAPDAIGNTDSKYVYKLTSWTRRS